MANSARLALVCGLLVAVFGLSVFAGTVIGKKLNLIDIDRDPSDGYESVKAGVEEDETMDFEPVHDIADADSLNDWLKQWAENDGEKLHSDNIITCLLCGVDSDNGMSEGGRADAMMIVSLNKLTKKITLVSVMRDSYTYMDINGKPTYYKLNSAYNYGGPATLVDTIENDYKITIDKYICVDFATFPKVIDSLGGITVEVKKYEANFINTTSSQHIDYGDAVHLNGTEALVLSRIRYCDADGDVSRTKRQRRIISAIIDKTKGASANQLNEMLNSLLPDVRTNYTKSQILSLSTQALMQGWLNYEIVQITSPLVSSDSGEVITGKDAYVTVYSSPEFAWIVDYQLDASRIQNAIYGTSNIEVSPGRVSPFDFIRSLS